MISLISGIMPTAMLADGSILVYNNSLYNLNVVVTTQTTAQAGQDASTYKYVQGAIAPAPVNADGTLVVHAVDANYPAGSNVPMGTVSNVAFTDNAIDFDIQILDAAGGRVVKQINVGKTLGTVVNSDPARMVYVYSNILADSGKPVPNSGGQVVYWDAAHAINSPSVQTFR